VACRRSSGANNSKLSDDIGCPAQLVKARTDWDQIDLIGADDLEPAQHLDQFTLGAGPPGSRRHSLDDLGIGHEPVTDIGPAHMLEFRDPDNIALEPTTSK
jgi:hypothetical protein